MEDVAVSRFSGVKNKYVLVLAIGLLSAILGVAYIVCGLQYEKTKEEILTIQEEALRSWVTRTTEAVTLWTHSLEDQAKRVSVSESYRAFAEEIESMGAKTSSTINSMDAERSFVPEGVAELVEQVPYMRNLLLDFMNLSGLTDARIVNFKGHTILSALSQPPPNTPEQRATAQLAISSGSFVFGPVRSAPAGLVIDYADPLRAVLDDSLGGQPVAALLLNRAVTGQIAQFLARDLRDGNMLRPRIVQTVGEILQELEVQSASPVVLDKERFPLTAAMEMPFGRRLALSGDETVFSLAMPVPRLGWHVVLEVPAAIVIEKMNVQKILIYSIGMLIGIGVALALALLWWILFGREQRAMAQKFEKLYTVIKQQKRILDSVNVSLDVGLLLVNVDGTIQVSNRAFAEIVGRNEADIQGANLNQILAPSACNDLLGSICHVVDIDMEDSMEISLPGVQGERLFRVSLYPFEDAESGEEQAGSVAIFQDITEFRRKSEQRRQQQVNTIAALVHAVESVDPYLAGHSLRMTELSKLVSTSMGLEQHDRDTVQTAASLSQMGKLFISRELLAKSGQLTPEEQAEITGAPEYANNVLRDIDFGLPVAQAVYEMTERMDGKGYPRQLSGDAISIHARILAVLNVFCAMVSPRSYRSGMPVNEALERLRGDESLDQNVVGALEKVLQTPEGLRIATPIKAAG